MIFNACWSNVLFLYPLKTSENLHFRGYRNWNIGPIGTLDRNELKAINSTLKTRLKLSKITLLVNSRNIGCSYLKKAEKVL